MANNTYLWSYLLFALLVFFMVLQQVALRHGNARPTRLSHARNVDHEISSDTDEQRKLTDAERRSALRDELQRIYRAEVGVRELSGKNDGKRVEEYLAATNLGKGHAWCAAFVSWAFAQAGFEEPNTPWSPALFPSNRLIWPQKADAKSAAPMRGDVFGIWFPQLKRIAHAGFVDEWGAAFVVTVEGNTNEAGSAEGDGVYRKRRPIGSLHSVANWVDRP